MKKYILMLAMLNASFSYAGKFTGVWEQKCQANHDEVSYESEGAPLSVFGPIILTIDQDKKTIIREFKFVNALMGGCETVLFTSKYVGTIEISDFDEEAKSYPTNIKFNTLTYTAKTEDGAGLLNDWKKCKKTDWKKDDVVTCEDPFDWKVLYSNHQNKDGKSSINLSWYVPEGQKEPDYGHYRYFKIEKM